jgi:hypothetical protein
MLRKMQVEIMFLNPNDVNCGIAKLIECDFDVTVRDAFDDYGPAVFITAWTLTELEESDFFDWTESILEPLSGEVCKAGLADQIVSEVAMSPVLRRC